jgi:hypothetical protein
MVLKERRCDLNLFRREKEKQSWTGSDRLACMCLAEKKTRPVSIPAGRCMKKSEGEKATSHQKKRGDAYFEGVSLA